MSKQFQKFPLLGRKPFKYIWESIHFPVIKFLGKKKSKPQFATEKKTNLITLIEASDILVVGNKLFSEYFRNILND